MVNVAASLEATAAFAAIARALFPRWCASDPKHHMHTPEERSRTFGAHSQRILNSVRHQVELICVSILEKQNGVHFWTQQVTRHAQTYAHTHAGFVPKEVRV